MFERSPHTSRTLRACLAVSYQPTESPALSSKARPHRTIDHSVARNRAPLRLDPGGDHLRLVWTSCLWTRLSPDLLAACIINAISREFVSCGFHFMMKISIRTLSLT